ncbi:carbamate kinase [Phycicoccus endophyticus]|uniref:Carbamate kinase n=1 Tax=Phycicoccus endophyticus TaxID=1690220 RepID=A0A7G9R416_9MICO|nr:carbamate kinase [Phycicoccus endophyticus]NHI18180.1 carbamate kinase [Phycicoccus endophyticus]QNN50341.1 carbamate kinase [Phycicoccus endophyticus]GGL25837.1 carbamate kinase [Phycicoccus endophyticus]
MRIVVALGGNALLRRGEPMTAENQRANIRVAAQRLALVVPGHEVVVAHGNGPQVGLLSLQAAAYRAVDPYPLDVLGAQTEAMIGYVVEQELGNLLPADQHLATVLTMVEVDPHDPAFEHPTKPIGPVYDRATGERLAALHGWALAPDGDGVRRVVASPRPRRIFEIEPIRSLLADGTVVICAGGGGIPTCYDAEHRLRGVEAVIDKDLASSLLARQLGADLLVIATDVDGVYLDWGTPRRRRLGTVTPEQLSGLELPAGSMGPKVEAACGLVTATGHDAVIGALADIADIVAGRAGTRVRLPR